MRFHAASAQVGPWEHIKRGATVTDDNAGSIGKICPRGRGRLRKSLPWSPSSPPIRLGMPLFTTHELSFGVAGTMAANGLVWMVHRSQGRLELHAARVDCHRFRTLRRLAVELVSAKRNARAKTIGHSVLATVRLRRSVSPPAVEEGPGLQQAFWKCVCLSAPLLSLRALRRHPCTRDRGDV